MKHISLFLLACVFVAFPMAGQTPMRSNGLTDAQIETIQNRTKQKVEEFQAGMKKIADNSLPGANRKEHVLNTLDLFIGAGDPYDYYDELMDQRVHNTGVKMQTTSVNSERKASQKLKSYIYKFYNPNTGKSSMPYSKIIIEAADAVRIDNIQKVGDHYECIAYFTQKFIGFRGDRISYSDLTTKKVRCYITHIDLPEGDLFDCKLGDIYAVSTERLYN